MLVWHPCWINFRWHFDSCQTADGIVFTAGSIRKPKENGLRLDVNKETSIFNAAHRHAWAFYPGRPYKKAGLKRAFKRLWGKELHRTVCFFFSVIFMETFRGQSMKHSCQQTHFWGGGEPDLYGFCPTHGSSLQPGSVIWPNRRLGFLAHSSGKVHWTHCMWQNCIEQS